MIPPGGYRAFLGTIPSEWVTMTLWDQVSIVIGVAAIAGTVLLLAVLALWPRRRTSIDAIDIEPPEVPIRITFGDGPAWRIDSLLDHCAVVVDTFTFRCCDGRQPGPWHHELMDRAIRLLPGQTAQIPSPIDGEHWDAAAGWEVVDHGERRRGSDYAHVARTRVNR